MMNLQRHSFPVSPRQGHGSRAGQPVSQMHLEERERERGGRGEGRERGGREEGERERRGGGGGRGRGERYQSNPFEDDKTEFGARPLSTHKGHCFPAAVFLTVCF